MKAKATKRRTPKPPDRATVKKRVDQVLGILLDGAEAWDVRAFITEKQAANEPPWDGPPVTDKALAVYVVQAKRQIAKATPDAQAIKTHLAKRRNLYAKAVSQGDVRAALQCLRDEANLLGLYERKGPRKPAQKPPAVAQLTEPNGIAGLLANTLAKLQAGEIDTKTAATIGGLATLLARVRGEEDQADEARQLLDLRNLEQNEGAEPCAAESPSQPS
jgi:hypothetical protein